MGNVIARMLAFFTWLYLCIEAFPSRAAQAFNTIKNSDLVKNTLPTLFIEAKKGLVHSLKMPVYIYNNLKYLKVRELARQVFIQNIVLYLGSIFTSLFTYNKLREYFEYNEEDTGLSSYLFYAGFYIMAARLFCRMFIYNTAYNLTAPIVIREDKASLTKLPGCPCKDESIMQANLSAPFHYIGNMIGMSIFANLPYIGKIVTYTARPMIYGQALVEYKLSEAGVCEKHRVHFYKHHNAHCFGVGMGAVILTEALSALIYWGTGVRSFFIEDAIFSALYPHFIQYYRQDGIARNIQKEPGFDLFYYNRLIVNDSLLLSSNWIIHRIHNPHLRGPLVKRLISLNNASITQFLKFILFGSDLRKPEVFVTTPAIRYYLKLQYDKIIPIIDTLIEARKWRKFLYLSTFLENYIPTFIASENTILLLKILKRDEIEGKLEYLKHLIDTSQDNNFRPIVNNSARSIAEYYIENYTADKTIKPDQNECVDNKKLLKDVLEHIHSEIPTPPVRKAKPKSTPVLEPPCEPAPTPPSVTYRVQAFKPARKNHGLKLK